MIKEEDHIRMQSLRPGTQTQGSRAAIDKDDNSLEKEPDYSLHVRTSDISRCPTTSEHGSRVSDSWHFSRSRLAEQTNPIIQSVNQLGLDVRGISGEGTEALGTFSRCLLK